MTRTHYDPQSYWENRLSGQFSLTGVGHIGFDNRYNHWLYRRKDRCLSDFLRDHLLPRGKSILDVGCGTGFFVEAFTRRGGHVSGMDITRTSVDRLRDKYGAAFYIQDISARDYTPPQLFDVVNIWDVLYHVVDDSRFNQALANLTVSVKPGGYLLLSDYLGNAADTSYALHVRGRSLATYSAVLGANGFELVSLRPMYRFLDRKNLGTIDKHLGPLYFLLDSLFNRRVRADNVAFAAWRRR